MGLKRKLMEGVLIIGGAIGFLGGLVGIGYNSFRSGQAEIRAEEIHERLENYPSSWTEIREENPEFYQELCLLADQRNHFLIDEIDYKRTATKYGILGIFSFPFFYGGNMMRRKRIERECSENPRV